jgi:hypothetical protein
LFEPGRVVERIGRDTGHGQTGRERQRAHRIVERSLRGEH